MLFKVKPNSQIHHKLIKLPNSQTPRLPSQSLILLDSLTMFSVMNNQSLSSLPLHMVDWRNPAVQFLYNQSHLLTPEDFAMIDEMYDEIDTGNEGLQCEKFTEDTAFVVDQHARNPDAIESFQDENDVELIEDENGHIVIQPDDDDDDDGTPQSWCESLTSPRYFPTSPRYSPTSPRSPPPPLHTSPRTPSPTHTRETGDTKSASTGKKPTLKRNVKIAQVVEGPMNTIRYYKADIMNGPEKGNSCYIPAHLLEKGVNARVGDIFKAIVFPTDSAKCDFRAIKCLPMDEMVCLKFRLSVFGEQNVGLLIGQGGSNLMRLSKLASPPGSTYFPRIKLTKKYDSIVEFTYKKNSHINKENLIENIKKTHVQPTWAVSPQYVIEKQIE